MKRKQSLLFLVILFCLSGTARLEATTYTVKTGGGGNYTTIQACANVAVAGDTCVVYAGTYSETVTPANSGTAGNSITYAVNPGDCVTVTGFSLGSLSYITLGTPSANTCTNGSLNYSGFEITGQVIWTQISNMVFQNNYAHSNSGQCFHTSGGGPFGSSSFNSLLNNIITFCGGIGAGLTGGINIEGDHWLIDSNNFSHLQSAVQLYGSFNVVRNNNFGPLNTTDYASQHTQPLESTCSGDFPLVHMLYENNVSHDWRGPNAHAFLMRDTGSCGMTGNIIRFSPAYNLGSDWTANDTNSQKTYAYNNSVSNIELDQSPKNFSSYTFTFNDTGNVVVNMIFLDNTRPASSDWCIYVDTSSEPGFVENHNLCFLTGYNGPWQQPYSGYTYSATDIFNQNPMFVNSSGDLHLQAGSPAIQEGGPLTAVSGSDTGSGTSLIVNDAGFFQDGYGIPGVQADWIRVGATTTVQVSSVNYSTNTLTLASGISRSAGNPVYLYKNSNGTIVLFGSAPDMGAFPFSVAPPNPPTNLTAVPH
jgi:hypothetical protein